MPLALSFANPTLDAHVTLRGTYASTTATKTHEAHWTTVRSLQPIPTTPHSTQEWEIRIDCGGELYLGLTDQESLGAGMNVLYGISNHGGWVGDVLDEEEGVTHALLHFDTGDVVHFTFEPTLSRLVVSCGGRCSARVLRSMPSSFFAAAAFRDPDTCVSFLHSPQPLECCGVQKNSTGMNLDDALGWVEEQLESVVMDYHRLETELQEKRLQCEAAKRALEGEVHKFKQRFGDEVIESSLQSVIDRVYAVDVDGQRMWTGYE